MGVYPITNSRGGFISSRNGFDPFDWRDVEDAIPYKHIVFLLTAVTVLVTVCEK